MSGKRVRFEKWEGLGNDFVVVEADASAWSDEDVRAVCDRRRGVGADGVLFVTRGGQSEGGGRETLSRMIVRNADGSRPEMCGNGIRCVAGYLGARGLVGAGEVAIATDAGTKVCAVLGKGEGEGYRVAVEMGAVSVGGVLAAEIEGRTHRFTMVDVGNPHAITFEGYEEAEIERVGPRVATLPAGGTNVEFCRVVRGEDGAVRRVDVVVWERGVGRTLACGTGACAVAAAACAAGVCGVGAEVKVRLPGGELEIVIAGATGTEATESVAGATGTGVQAMGERPGGEARKMTARMTGPARRVFVGELGAS